MSRLVRFSEISETGNHFELVDNSWIPAEMVAAEGSVQAKIVLTKKGPTEVELRGHLAATVQLVCDRCLVNFAKQVAVDLQLLLRCTSEDQWNVHSVEYTEADLEIIILPEPQVELGDILRQQLYLSLPLKQLCDENCRGLCPKCGTNLNERRCDCHLDEVKSPFAVLAHLKKKQ